MIELLHQTEGAVCYMDDILVFGSNKEEHDERLLNVMKVIRDSGLKLNREKCRIRQEKLNFLGHVISKEGVAVSPEKAEVIQELPQPENTTQLKQVMGLVNYLGRFLPNLSTEAKPLYDLMKSDSAWIWDEQQKSAFQKIKDLVSSSEALAYYDPNKETMIRADASSFGIGGVILQLHDSEWKPVAYCSRSLSESEKKYAQIEKECLASVWVCERFYRYLCGLPQFRLVTDHKPLVTLFNQRDLDLALLRCQRLLIRMMKFNPVAEHAPGKDLVIADALSRNPMVQQGTQQESKLTEEIRLHISSVEAQLPIADQKLEVIRQKTEDDPQLKKVKQYILNGWPKHDREVASEAKIYAKLSSELSEHEGLILLGKRIVIPVALRQDMLERIHTGHQGVSKCRERARMSVFWPGITRDIEHKVTACVYCQTHQPAQRKEPLKTTSLPSGPWTKIGADICEYKGQRYLILVDYFSRFIEILQVRNMTSETVIRKMKHTFARWGIPQELISDNARYFTSEEFKAFSDQYGFKHTTSSPYLPQSNGEAERAVQTAKKILCQDDPAMALLAYHSTPVEATGETPAQLLIGRQLRTTLPTIDHNLTPRWPDLNEIKERDRKAKEDYAKFYNRRFSTRNLPRLSPGTEVRIKTEEEKTWSSPAMVEKEVAPRSYVVNKDGVELRRNRRHIHETNNTPGTVQESGSAMDSRSEDTSSVRNQVSQPSGQPETPSKQTTTPIRANDSGQKLSRFGRKIIKPARYRSDT